MHDAAMSFVVEALNDLKFQNGGKAICELGSLDVNGSVSPLFAGCAFYVGVDVRGGRGVDVVANAAHYGEPNAFDLVVSTECLEHALDARNIVLNAYRILKPGGACIVTAAAPNRAPHGNDGGDVSGEFYQGIDIEVLKEWFSEAGFDPHTVRWNVAAGDVYGVAHKPKASRR